MKVQLRTLVALDFLQAASCGIFIEGGNGILRNGEAGLSIKLHKKFLKRKKDAIISLKVVNNGKKAVRINSLIVADLEISTPEFTQVLENGWGQSSFSGYKKISDRTKKKRLFLQRDQNPFSFNPQFGYVRNSIISEWYTELIGEGLSIVIGAITTQFAFSQIFVKQEKQQLKLRLSCQLDGFILKPGQTVQSELFAVLAGLPTETLNRFALLLKKYSGPRKLPKSFSGFCSAYYHQGNKVGEDDVLKELSIIDTWPNNKRFDYFQIDAGYSVWGDWLESRNSFPLGMKQVTFAIKKRGMKAGIWLAPFVASPYSNLYKKHPEWFLKNKKGEAFEGRLTSPFDILPMSKLRVLDVTQLAVQRHLAKVIKYFVRQGFEFLKLDFLYPVCFSTNYHKTMTRVQALRLGLNIIKKAAGKKVCLMSGISQLSPLVGLVDSVRIGMDTTNPYSYHKWFISRFVNEWMLRENLRNAKSRQFLNNRVWLNDVDCLVTSPKSGLSQKLIDEHHIYIKKYGGSRWFGDSLVSLSKINYKKYIANFFRVK